MGDKKDKKSKKDRKDTGDESVDVHAKKNTDVDADDVDMEAATPSADADNTPSADVDETEEERAARKAAKKAKKEAKRAKKEQQRLEEERASKQADAADPGSSSEDEASAPKKSSKKEKGGADPAVASSSSSSSSSAADSGAGHKRRREEDAAPTSNSKSAAAVSSSSGSSSSSSYAASTTGASRRSFYTKSASLAKVSATAIETFRADKNITVEDRWYSGSDGGATTAAAAGSSTSASAWAPVMEFSQLGENFPPHVLAATKAFTTPSPIQAQSWPIVMSGRDMIGIAATGSGKTLAFTLPGFVHILAQQPLKGSGKGSSDKSSAGPVMLVLSPTRELAMQTAAVAVEAGKAAGIRSTCIFGGVPKGPQIADLTQAGGAGVHIVVATPGRLLDLAQDGCISLARVTYLVLDEADRMLDMGFEKDIRSIVGMIRTPVSGGLNPAAAAAFASGPSAGIGRQTVMFSATWPPAIQKIASEFLHEPVKVTIGSGELAASKTVTQLVDVCEPHARDALLLKLLQQYHGAGGRKNRIIIFVLYKKEAARMEGYLKGRGWSCCAIHGDMSQDARTRAFTSFRDGTVPLLVATDVAARGLDIPAVEYVINYSFPLTIEDYVHRIGRTGRAGKTGISHTFFTQLDKAHAGELVNVLREQNQAIPADLLKFGTHVKKKEHALYGAHFKSSSGDGDGSGGAPAAPSKMKFDDDE